MTTTELNRPIGPLTTMRVGGPAARLVTVTTTDELVDAVREVDDADEPLLVLGGGSNVVVSDDGFPGTVVRVATTGIQVESRDRCGGAFVRVAAGHEWDSFVAEAVEQGWSGVEALSGIPGLAGATPVQNVGAYGQEVSGTIASVRVWDRQLRRVQTFALADCGFGYRTSRFKQERYRSQGRYVVLDVAFQLVLADLSAPVRYADLAAALEVEIGDRVSLADARDAVLEQRRRRGMVLDPADHDTWSCGSFFTNPVIDADELAALRERVRQRAGAEQELPSYPAGEQVKVSAAWLIERAGFGKGFGLPGPAAVSGKHSLAVTNRGQADAQDVIGLARRIRDGVREVFGVELTPEPVLVGLTL